MNTDPIADLLTRVRNASAAGHPTVTIPASKTKEQVLRVLQEEGYIEAYEVLDADSAKKRFKVVMSYQNNGRPAIQEIDRLSRPGKRLYVAAEDVPKQKGGLGLVVVSTSRGMMSDREARKQGIGGELICSVF
jgi:small subunit ribosomal protein S8